MADPEGPPTLFKLAIDALVAGCKLGSYTPTLDPQKIPPAVGNLVLNQISLMDMIIIASNENLYDWIASILPDNFVRIGAGIENKSNQIRINIEWDGRPKLIWDFVKYLNASIDQSQFFMLKIADQFFPIKHNYSLDHFDKFVSNSETAERFEIQLKIIEWICQLFRRGLNEFWFSIDSMNYLKSSTIITARTIWIGDCTQYTFFKKLLIERHRRGLKTHIENVYIAEPLQFSSELFQNVKISRIADINLTCYSFEEIVQIVTKCMSRIRRIQAKIPNWSSKDLRVFSKRFNLSQSTNELKSRYNLNEIFGMVESGNCQDFYKIEDGLVKMFRFARSQSGQFAQLLRDAALYRNL